MALPLKNRAEIDWTAWSRLEDLPEGVRHTLKQALFVPMLGDEEISAMEVAFMQAAVKAVREIFWRERAHLLLHKLQRQHPSMKRRAMYRAIALYLGKSENTIRILCSAREPGKDAELLDLKEGA